MALQDKRRAWARAISMPSPRVVAAAAPGPTVPTDEATAEARKVWEFYAARDTSPSSDEIRREQYADLECSELINFLLTETVPPNLFGQALKRFVTVASACYTIRDGLLFRIQTDPRAGRDNESLQLVIPVSLREAFLEAWHERMGHPGIEKTYQLLRARVY